MFENVWGATLATFSLILEQTTDDQIAHLCIDGLILSIKISGFFHMEMERDAFLSVLSKFITISDSRRIKPKNVWCI
jgi:brefeldin A-inhibited guanine nucleotide-exchange protein